MQTKQELYALGLAAMGLLALSSGASHASTGTLPALKARSPAALSSAANAITVRDISAVENGTRIVVESAQPFSPRVQTIVRPSATLITIPGLWDGAGARYTNVRQNGVFNVRTGVSRENGKDLVRLVANSRQRLASTVEASPDKKRWIITLWKPGYRPTAEVVAASAAANSAAITAAPALVRTAVKVKAAPVANKSVPTVVVTALKEAPRSVLAAPVVPSVKRAVAVRQKVTAGFAAPSRAATAPTFTAAATQPGARRVSLDFVGADISEVVKALALQSGINIILATNGSAAGAGSGAIQDKITVSLKRVSFAEALDTVVNLSGYRYARIGDTYAVGPPEAVAALARGSSVGVQTSASIPFIFSDGTSLKASIESAFPTLKGRVSVVTIGSEGKLGGTVPSFAASGPSAATPSPSVGALQTDPNAAGAAPAGGGYNRVIPKGGVVNISASPAEIDAVRAYIEATEVALTEAPYREQISQSKRFAGLTTQVYQIKYASAPDLIQVLQQLAPNVNVTPGPTQGFQTTSTGQSLTYTATPIVTAGGTVLAGGGAPGGAATGGPANTSVTVTNKTLSLLLTGVPEELARAQDILGKVDVRSAQLIYEAKIVDISQEDLLNLGIQYPDLRSPGVGVGVSERGGTKPILGSFGSLYRTGVNFNANLFAAINNNKGRVLSNPNLTALDGQTATAFIGDQIKYVTQIQQTPQGQTVTTETATVGITLKVTGRYSPDGTITLYVHPEVSAISSFLAVAQGISLPQISTRYVDTTVRVKDGETIGIGGLIRENEVRNMQRIPLLSDIPFFGELFKYRNNTKQKSEIVVFITSRLAKE